MSAANPTRPVRSAPLAAWYQGEGGSRVLEDMAMPAVPPPPAGAAVRLCDRSWRRRFGCKGPAAEAWLANAGLAVPRGANSIHVDAAGILVARLATSEFLIEAVAGGSTTVAAAGAGLAGAENPAGVYPVARQDLVVELAGAGLGSLLRQVCSVDFEPLFAAPAGPELPLVLTSMVGVGVVAWPRGGPRGPNLTLWADPSFAAYLWTTLREVGGDLAGGIAVTDPGADVWAAA